MTQLTKQFLTNVPSGKRGRSGGAWTLMFAHVELFSGFGGLTLGRAHLCE